MSVLGTLFDNVDGFWNEIVEQHDNGAIPRCRTCSHRKRFALNEHSHKVIQCCELQPSKKSNSGYKTIKVTNKACLAYMKIK